MQLKLGLILGTRRAFEVQTRSPEETTEFGRTLARELEPPCVVLLEGELGSGKTTLTKGLVNGLGAAREEDVTSPTFALVHEYGEERKVYHVDLYRVETPQELATLGLDEMFSQPSVVIIEWGEKLWNNARVARIRIQMETISGEVRRITVEQMAAQD